MAMFAALEETQIIIKNFCVFQGIIFGLPYLATKIYEKYTNYEPPNTSKIQSVHVIDAQKPRLPTELSKPPSVAIPTVILTVINLIIWFIVQLLYSYNYLSYRICLFIWVINIYVAFTPLHDSTHSSIATKQSGYRFLNGLIGRICALIFVAPYPAFKYVHLQHHKYTNIPNMDPDYYAIDGYWFILPFKWFTQIFKYNYVYLLNIRKQPILDVFEMIIFLIGPDIIGRRYNIEKQLFYQWVWPSWIAATYLVMVFDYIPHRGHKNDNLFIGTNVTSLHGKTDKMIQALTMPLLFQNYHNIHHLYPWVPFYKYSKIWFQFNHYLLKKGTQIRSLFPIF